MSEEEDAWQWEAVLCCVVVIRVGCTCGYRWPGQGALERSLQEEIFELRPEEQGVPAVREVRGKSTLVGPVQRPCGRSGFVWVWDRKEAIVTGLWWIGVCVEGGLGTRLCHMGQ